MFNFLLIETALLVNVLGIPSCMQAAAYSIQAVEVLGHGHACLSCQRYQHCALREVFTAGASTYIFLQSGQSLILSNFKFLPIQWMKNGVTF